MSFSLGLGFWSNLSLLLGEIYSSRYTAVDTVRREQFAFFPFKADGSAPEGYRLRYLLAAPGNGRASHDV